MKNAKTKKAAKKIVAKKAKRRIRHEITFATKSDKQTFLNNKKEIFRVLKIK